MMRATSRQFVFDMIRREWPNLPSTFINKVVDDAQTLLGDLVHYETGKMHEGEDILAAALALTSARWPNGRTIQPVKP